MIRGLFLRLAVAAAVVNPALASALDSPALRQLHGLTGGTPPPDAPAAPQAAEPLKIDWQDAGKHIGETVVVEGKIVRSYANEKVCFLNFGDYKTTVTLVIFSSAYKDFPAGPQYYYEEKTVRATGQIQLSPRGTPQIILGSPDQITLTSPGAHAVLNWEDVTAAHENQIVTVEGVVEAVSKSERVAYLNFHQNWSRYVAGTIFASVFPHFRDIEGYQGKKVQMTGRVKLYEGRPELLLFSEAQVKVVGGPAPKTHRLRLAKKRVDFDDGDSLQYELAADESPDGKPFKGGLRLLGFDTPETLHPEDGIFYDQQKGDDADALARAAFKSAKKIEFVTHGERDKYGRMLGHLVLDGELLGVLQLRAGLAYEMVSSYGDNGFAEEAAKLWDAWTKGPINEALAENRKPPFLKPGDWRQINQVHDLAIPRATWDAMSREERRAVLLKVKQVVDGRRRASRGGLAPAP